MQRIKLITKIGGKALPRLGGNGKIPGGIPHLGHHRDDGLDTDRAGVDAVNSKSGLFCYRCGGQGHIAAKCSTPAPTKGKGKDGGRVGKAGGKGGGNREKGKGEWNGFCFY